MLSLLLTLSLDIDTSVCVQGFADGSILPEDLGQEEGEPELILDGSFPRYTSPLTPALTLNPTPTLTTRSLNPTPTPTLTPSPNGEEREMAVDDDEEEDDGVEDRGGQVVDPYPRKPPPSWGEWARDNGGPLLPASVHSGAQEKVSAPLLCAGKSGESCLASTSRSMPTRYCCNTPDSTHLMQSSRPLLLLNQYYIPK